MKKLFKIIFLISLLGFIMLNIIAYNHAYHFTHFSEKTNTKTARPEELSFWKKIKIVFSGIENPKPKNDAQPLGNYETIFLKKNNGQQLETWKTNAANAKGTVILFHGYTGKKSDLIEVAIGFNQLNYNTLLVDFEGTGGSSGASTSVGFGEADDVLAVVNYLAKNKKTNSEEIILYGVSMGAVAVLRAMSLDQNKVDKIIIECPFGSLLKTIKNRFEIMGVPAFPAAHLLVFWGGVQNGYSGFSHNAINYAHKIKTPTLIMYGGKDKRADKESIVEIYEALKTPVNQKKILPFKNAQHQLFYNYDKTKWVDAVNLFLGSNN